MDLEIGIDGFYDTILIKPKQLVEIKHGSIEIDNNKNNSYNKDYNGVMTTNKSMVLDILLHSLQIFAHNNKDIDIKELYNKWFTIKYSKFLELYDKVEDNNKTGVSKNSKQSENIREMRNIANYIMKFNVESRSQNGMRFSSMVVFPNVDIFPQQDIIKFKANTEIINAMFSKNKIIGEENKHKAKASYIKYDYNEIHRYSGLSLTANKLYCLLLSNIGMFQEYGKFSINIEDLKDIICIESDRNSYVKNKIEMAMTSVNKYLKTNYSLKLLTGFRGRIVSVTIINNDLKIKRIKNVEPEIIYLPEEIIPDRPNKSKLEDNILQDMAKM